MSTMQRTDNLGSNPAARTIFAEVIIATPAANTVIAQEGSLEPALAGNVFSVR
jgi:hypothetical protein